MSPKKRNKENLGLPSRWRLKHGAYYYRPHPDKKHLWDGKSEYFLGHKLSDAYRVYAERIEVPHALRYMHELFQRYGLEVIPEKEIPTQRNEQRYLITLVKTMGDMLITDVEPVHVYQLMDALAKKRVDDDGVARGGQTMANQVVALLSHVFTKAIEWGACSDHPIKNKVVKRKVSVTRRVPELHEIESALACANKKLQYYVQLKLMTGLRMTDMLSMKTKDLKEDGIHVKPSKTASSTGKAIIIQWDSENVLKTLTSDIRKLRGVFTSEYLFCTQRGKPYINVDPTHKNYKKCNGFQSMWQRWQNKAISEGLIEHKFSEKSLRNRVGSDAESAERGAELLGHASTDTTRKHYRNAPVKVLPMVRKNAQTKT